MTWTASSIISSVNVHYNVCGLVYTVDISSCVIRVFLVACATQTVGNLKSYTQKSPTDVERLESTRGVDLLCLAATYGRTDIVHILLKRLDQDDIEPEELFDLNSSLHQACKLNNKQMVEMLLKAGATPWVKDDDGFSAMHHSAYNGSLEASYIPNCSLFDHLVVRS